MNASQISKLSELDSSNFPPFLVLVVSYTYLFLDQHLGFSLKGTENIHGAQVDVIGLKTKLFQGTNPYRKYSTHKQEKNQKKYLRDQKNKLSVSNRCPFSQTEVVIENISLERYVDTRRDRLWCCIS